MTRNIAFFDFDGTITRSDTLPAFIRFCKGTGRMAAGWLSLLPVLVLYKVGLRPNHWAKERVLARFFGGMPADVFQHWCNRFAAEVLPALVRKAAVAEIEALKKAGYTIVVVSASPENWLAPWCKQHGLELLATRLEVRQARITGMIAGINCHGEEKVRRIKMTFNLSEFHHIAAYGDTPGDKPMLALATRACYKPFR